MPPNDHQETFELSRGGRKITLTKQPEYFAVRLTQGRATSLRALEANLGAPESPVRHVDSVTAENLEVFAVEEAEDLEGTMDALRLAPRAAVVTHVYTVDDTPQGNMIPTGALTLQFKPNVTAAQREALLAEYALEIVESLDYLPNGYRVRVTQASADNPLKVAVALQQRAELLVAEPDLAFTVAFQHVPTDPLYVDQWHLKNRGGQAGLQAGADVKAEGAWDVTTGKREIIVAVIDDGFDLGHPEFDAPGKLVAPRDFGQNDFDPNPVLEDDNHGTACAGVAVAEENGEGVVGLAPRCALMPIRMAPWLSDQSIAAMFGYARDNGAAVISCSWTAGSWNFPLSTAMNAVLHQVATQGRGGKGCVILFAAGNDNRPLDGVMNGQPSVQGFGLHPDVICVGASNSLDQRSSYSNYGPALSLCAPSSGSPGRRIVTTDRRGTRGYMAGDYTTDFGGTSSATPLAAGLAALILSANPDLTAAEVRQIMMETADKIDPGSGAYVNGHSPWFGAGRIHAERAVRRAAGLDQPQGLPKVLTMEHRVQLAIPDMGQVEDTIPFPLDVAAREIEVMFDIHHTFRGDLQIALLPPGGQAITLWQRSGGSADDLHHTVRASAEPGLLGGVLGAKAGGDWRLRVSDMARQDEGILVRWSLAITY
jgi:subtilisin family serine protease